MSNEPQLYLLYEQDANSPSLDRFDPHLQVTAPGAISIFESGDRVAVAFSGLTLVGEGACLRTLIDKVRRDETLAAAWTRSILVALAQAQDTGSFPIGGSVTDFPKSCGVPDSRIVGDSEPP
jgi:hypothetical protein